MNENRNNKLSTNLNLIITEVEYGKQNTQASRASNIGPRVQKHVKAAIQEPLFSAGTNSRNQVGSTWLPPRPRPTTKRKASKVA